MKEFWFETYKIILSMALVATIGVVLEYEFSESARERETELLLLDRAIDHYEEFGSALASLRSLIYRMSDTDFSVDTKKQYEQAYSDFTKSKLPFVLNLQRADIGSQVEQGEFNELNVLVIEMDSCISRTFNKSVSNKSCDLGALYTEYVQKSTSFEETIYSMLLSRN